MRITLVIILCLVITGWSAEKPNVIVFTLSEEGISKKTSILVSERIRERLSSSGKVRVLERNEIDKILETIGQNLDDCTEEGCGIELGRQLDAEKIVTGSITQIGRRITISTNFIDVATTEREITVSKDIDDATEEKIVDYIPSLVKKLTDQIPLVGKVIEIIKDTVIVDIGPEVGIKQDDELIVVRRKPLLDPDTGELRGYLPQTIGQLRVHSFINQELSRCVIVSSERDFEEIVKKRYNDMTQIRVQMDIMAVTLDIKSNPSETEIYMNGEKKLFGLTPLITRLKPGAYQFKFHKDGYQDKTETVLLESGEQQKLNITLKPETGKLTVISDPHGADLYIDGKYIDQTPYSDNVPSGDYKIELKKKNYLDEQQLINVKPKRDNVIRVNLTSSNWKMKKKWKSDAIVASLFIPGRGQINNGQMRGWLYLMGFGASIAMGLNSQNEYNNASDAYDAVNFAYEAASGSPEQALLYQEMVVTRDDMTKWKDQTEIMWMAAGGIWAWNVIDAMIWGGNKDIALYGGSQIQFASSSSRVGIRIKF